MAVLSLIARRPVKISLSMEEQFFTITKHASTFRIKSGVDKDGRIVARECEVWWNGGAYADIGPRVTQKSGFTAPGPYDIDNVSIDSYALYTNLVPAGALRGFGIPQLVWAYESHTDMMARELGIDSVEFRRRNLLRDGRPQATGTVMRDAAIEKVLDRLEAMIDWKKPLENTSKTLKKGRGIAIGFKACVSPTTSLAMVTVNADGSCIVYCSTADMGQGSDTAMAQIVAEVLGIPLESITVVHPDTDVTPYDMATLGSRSTYHMGNAVRRAAEEARDKLLAAAREVGVSVETTPIAEVFRKKYGMQAGNIVGTGSFVPAYQPTTAIVRKGPYRFTRNPIYLALLLLLVNARRLWRSLRAARADVLAEHVEFGGELQHQVAAALPGCEQHEGDAGNGQREPAAVVGLEKRGGKEREVDDQEKARGEDAEPQRVAPGVADDEESEQRVHEHRARHGDAVRAGKARRGAEADHRADHHGAQHPVDARDVNLANLVQVSKVVNAKAETVNATNPTAKPSDTPVAEMIDPRPSANNGTGPCSIVEVTSTPATARGTVPIPMRNKAAAMAG